MNVKNYEILKKIKLDKSGVISSDSRDPIYKFCISNDIDNLADFVNVYYDKRNLIKSDDICYFDGIIDYINYVFLNIELPNTKYLNKTIRIHNNEEECIFYAYVDEVNNGRCKSISLKRLGFNIKEILSLLGYTLYLNKELRVIEVINLYLKTFDLKNMSLDDEIFLAKLYNLSKYFEQNKNEIENDFIKEVGEQIEEFKKLYDECSNIKLIIEKSYYIEKNLSELSQNRDDVKKLIKDYQSFICNK